MFTLMPTILRLIIFTRFSVVDHIDCNNSWFAFIFERLLLDANNIISVLAKGMRKFALFAKLRNTIDKSWKCSDIGIEH